MGDKFAIVTGASTGIGYELAKRFVEERYDVLMAAGDAGIVYAAATLRGSGKQIEALEVDLSSTEGVDRLYAAVNGRPVDALLANAGRGLGHSFLDHDFDRTCHIIDTNVTRTVYLVHKIGNDMRQRNAGRILITGSIAGFIPGSFQAVYNGSKAFLNFFSFAMREELKETGVTVTCLMPGPTETDFFERADMMDIDVGTSKKDNPTDVAQTGFDAMLRGDGDLVAGLKNNIQAAVANITPAPILAKQHRKMVEPGSAKG